MSVEDPLEFWLDSLNTDSTRDRYGRRFREFLGFMGMDARGVLALREEDMKTGGLVRRKRFENLLRKFRDSLDGKVSARTGMELGYSVKKISYTAVLSFFSFYDLPLQMRRQDAPKGSYRKEGRPVSRREIRRLLGVSDVYERALLLFLKDTGISRIDVSKLKLGNVGQELNREGGWRGWFTVENTPISVRGERVKTKIRFHTFIGSESVEALRVCFEMREKGTNCLDSRGRGVPSEKLTLQSSLLRCKTTLKPLGPRYIGKIIELKTKQCDIRGVTTHSFRHFFQTTLETPDLGINPNWIRQMMGHKSMRGGWDMVSVKPNTNLAYSHPGDEQLKSAYEKAYPWLSVLPRHVDEERLRSLEDFREQSKTREEEYAERVERLERILDNAMALVRRQSKETEV